MNLFDAIYSSNIEEIKALVKKGCNLNDVFDEHDEGKTPIMTALEVDNQEVIQLLINLGADLSIKTSEKGDNALSWCSKFGTIRNFEFLMSTHLFDINQTDDEGNTPLILATKYGYDDMLMTILEYQPSLFVKNNNGEDAFSISTIDKVHDRSLTQEILSIALTYDTIKKAKCSSSSSRKP